MEWEGEIHVLFMKTEVDDHLTSCQMVIDFCERNNLFINKTWFKTPKRRVNTLKAPGDRSRQQLANIQVKHLFRNGLNDVQNLSRAHIGSDHNLLIGNTGT